MKIKAFLILALGLFSGAIVSAQCIVINEVLVNGPGLCDGSCTPNTEEWVELYNTCGGPVDISCFVMSDGDWSLTFPPGTIIPANGYFTIGGASHLAPAETPDLNWGTCGCVSAVMNIGIFTNGGEQIAIFDDLGTFVDGLLWNGGQALPDPSTPAPAVGSCPATDVVLPASTDPVWEEVTFMGSGLNGCTHAREFDGSPVWVDRCNDSITFGNSNSPCVIYSDSIIAITCPGNSDGEIHIVGVSNGTPPYEYSIDGGPFSATASFTGLGAATYQINIRDAGACEDSTMITLTDPAPLAFTEVVSNISCVGLTDGSILAGGATGGTPPYTYSLNGGPFVSSPNFTGLSAGTYSIVIQDANTCQDSVTGIVVVEPALLMGTDSTIVISCNGANDGEIHIVGVSGGTPTYNYSLDGITFSPSPSFTGVGPGSYAVFVQDANLCFVIAAVVSLTDPPPITFSDSVVNISCGGTLDGEIWAITPAGGTPPYEYSLDGGAYSSSPSFTGLAAGTYTLNIRDAGGCVLSAPGITVTAAGSISASSSSTDVTCNAGTDGSITISGVSGGSTPYTYSLDGGTPQASPTFGSQSAGSYTVTVFDDSGCSISLGPIVISEPTAITLTDSI